MQIAAHDAHVGAPRSVTHFSQRPPASKGVADEGVPAVMNRERFEARRSENPARGSEALSQRVTRERLDREAWNQ
jgi:hypothetical protein